jgi:hypothetical protein
MWPLDATAACSLHSSSFGHWSHHRRIATSDDDQTKKSFIVQCHTPNLRIELKPPYVCLGCLNYLYDQQCGEQIQYLI